MSNNSNNRAQRGKRPVTLEWIAEPQDVVGDRATTTATTTDPMGDTIVEQQSEIDTVHRPMIIRKVGLKRHSKPEAIQKKVKLERVLGLTVSSNASLDCDPHSGTVVYPSGCVLVLYSQRRNKQTHIINSLKKPITACKFSGDGRYLVTGECGHQPQVRVWDAATGEHLTSQPGHRTGINCVSFSPDGKYVVSVGCQADMLINVWDWRNNHIVASNKVSVKVKAIAFSADGDYFVTVGNRHVKFWYLSYHDMAGRNSKFESVPLMGRNAILGDQRNNYYCDVACGLGESKESTYVITKSGLLCEFNNRRLLNKWVELKTEFASSLTVSSDYILVGCSQGIIRCFRPHTLEFVCTLPRPHILGVDIGKGFTVRNELAAQTPQKGGVGQQKGKYADTVALTYDGRNKIVTAVYSDRSIYYWTLGDIKRIGKLNSFFYHSSCIWDLEVYPTANKNVKPLLPMGTFLTCSSDDTIRIWNPDFEAGGSDTIGKNNHYIYKKSYFSPELLKILYMEPELNHLCDPDLVQKDAAKNGNTGSSSNAKDESSTYDTKNGIRSIKFSADGRHLASGDRSGNIRIFDLELQKDLFKIEAHDAEVLCLEYSNEEVCGRSLLVSASRDRFIHVYDVNRQYSCIQNIDDHSSSIMSVKFVCDINNAASLQMISCGADKSLIFRRQNSIEVPFTLENQVVERATFYDMAVDSAAPNQIVTASQDRVVRIYNPKRAKNVTNFKGSLGDQGALIKIALDPSSTFLATSCTDKSIYIFDYQSGECLATTSGHAEIVTGLKFSPDGRHLISISGDGCVFAWRLPVEMTNAIAVKLGLPLITEQTCTPAPIVNRSLTLPLHSNDQMDSISSTANAAPLKFMNNTATLPAWAKNRTEQDTPSLTSSRGGSDNEQENVSKTLPRGRWAQKLAEDGLPDYVLQQGLVKQFANNFENMASSRSTPSTPSGTNSPTLRELKLNNRLSSNALLATNSQRERAKSSLSSGVEEDDDDRNTTDSENTYSHESTYRVNKNSGSVNSLAVNRSMVSSLSMANINDLRYDEDESSLEKNDKPEQKRLSAQYMSTEHLDRIDQRNRYLKQMFENMGSSAFENNANSASDDSGINQIDHSLTSSATSSGQNMAPFSNRQSLSSRLNHKTLSPLVKSGAHSSGYMDGGASDDANTLSDATDIPTELRPGQMLDPIKESADNGFITYSELTASSVPSTPTTITAATSFSTVAGLGSSTSGSQPSVSRKREELAKTINDAKKKLESLGWKSGTLKNSKSVANLRDPTLLRQLISEDTSGALHQHHQQQQQHQQHLNQYGHNGGQLFDDKLKHEQQQNFNSLTPFDTNRFRKSVSLSDLSFSQTLPRKLSIFRQQSNTLNGSNGPSQVGSSVNMNNYQFAPLWDSRGRNGAGGVLPQATNGTPTMGTLSRTPSSNTLNKVDMMRSQSTLVRNGGAGGGGGVGGGMNGGSGVWHNGQATPTNGGANVSMIKVMPQSVGQPGGMMLNPRSGRASAPPSQFRKSATNSSVSCASSRRGDSTEDDEELESAVNSDDDNSDEHRTLRPRPVTPPKPNILKQMRRGSASNQATPTTPMGPFVSGIYAQHHNTAQNVQPVFNSGAHPSSRRRLWGSDTMRSSKSEFNLANIGRDTPVRRQRNNSGNVWQTPTAPQMGERMDLSMTNPTSIPLSLDLCQHIINEMTFLTTYASRIYERASYSNNTPIIEYLSETLGQVGRDIHQITGSHNTATTTIANSTGGNSNSSTPKAVHQPSSALQPSPNFNSGGGGGGGDQQEMFQKFMAFMKFQNQPNHNSHHHNSSLHSSED